MNYLVYLSTSSKILDTEDLKQILVKIRYQYDENGITGMMLYSKGTFFQALEGEEEQLQRVFDRLKTDDIQKGVIKLKSGTEETRTFSNWSMGFKPSSTANVAQMTGFVDPLKYDFLKNYNAQHPAVSLLKSFAQHNLQY